MPRSKTFAAWCWSCSLNVFWIAFVLAAECRDPWITRAVVEVTRRAPDGSANSGECNPYRYGGSWSSYPDLLTRVRAYFARPESPDSRAKSQSKDKPSPKPESRHESDSKKKLEKN